MKSGRTGLGIVLVVLLVAAGAFLAARAMMGGDRLQIRELSRDGMRSPGYHVAVDEQSMTALWSRLVQPQERPAVDFTREWVLGAFMGERPTGGYRIDIQEVRLKGREITAVVTQKQPGPDDFVTMVFTYPGHVVAVERPPEPGEYTLVVQNPQGEPVSRLELRF